MLFDVKEQETEDLNYAKRKIRNFLGSLPEQIPNGTGFILPPTILSEMEKSLVSAEYNSHVWGKSLAANKNIQDDEMSIISEYVHGSVLEVGCGDGRVSSQLLQKTNDLIAIDYAFEVVSACQKKNRAIKCEHENIVRPSNKLKSLSFDCVCFFENGLGGILSIHDRMAAINNMFNLVKRGGYLILGLRGFDSFENGFDQLMPIKDTNIYGIYHTFTKNEATSWFGDIANTKVILGHERPAGGKAFFIVYQKWASNLQHKDILFSC